MSLDLAREDGEEAVSSVKTDALVNSRKRETGSDVEVRQGVAGLRNPCTLSLERGRDRVQVCIPLELDQEQRLGSDSGCDVVIEGGGVRPQHAALAYAHGGVSIRAIGAAPLLVNGGPAATAVSLSVGDWVSIGEELFRVVGAPVAAPQHGSERRAGAECRSWPLQSPRLGIGRLAENEIRLASPMVSRRHAQLVHTNAGWSIEDLGSTNGTFVGGRRLHGRTQLVDGQRFSIAEFVFECRGDVLSLVEKGGVAVEARNIEVAVRDADSRRSKKLLEAVSLYVEAGEFVAIIGPAGSGKTTLMQVLSGRRSPASGKVLFDSGDLYRTYDAYRNSIGYVPQQDIVHRKLRVCDALAHTARLRLPPDTTAEEVQGNVSRVLEEVSLREQARLRVECPPLSGGQLKRVNVATELVCQPQILFLDEPTSGLDPGNDRRLMQLFARLAASGRTVICVTHNVENLDFCNRVILLSGGRVIYVGPPGMLGSYFGVSRASDIYDRLEGTAAAQWAAQLEASPLSCVRGGVTSDSCSAEPAGRGAPRHRRRRLATGLHQTRVLTGRYMRLMLTDRRNLAVLLVQAPVVALLIGLVFDTDGNLQERARAESQICFLLVLSAVWFGCLNASREVVKELPIYLRERHANVGIVPYLASKMIPLAMLCVVQCGILLSIATQLTPIPGDHAARGVLLVLSGLAATCMGLAVSAVVASTDKAIAMIPILLIPQVIFSNVLVGLDGVPRAIARAAVISYWSFDAVKQTLAREVREVVNTYESFGVSHAALAAFCVAFLLLAAGGLRWKDRHG